MWHARFSLVAGARFGLRRVSPLRSFDRAARRRRVYLRSVYFMVHNIALMELGAGKLPDEVRRLLRPAAADFGGDDEYFRENVAATVCRAVEDALAGVHSPEPW